MRIIIVILLLFCGAASADVYPGMPDGKRSYQELVETYDDFLVWLRADNTRKDFDPAAIAERREAIGDFHARLDNLAVRDWPLEQQSEFLGVRARIDQEYFRLNVTRPWARDPGFYVDQMLYLTSTELPLEGDALQQLRDKLATIPTLVANAMGNLNDVAADYADLAIFNLSNADGVGHGFPYRSTPPAGIIGWYEDLLGRAGSLQSVYALERHRNRNLAEIALPATADEYQQRIDATDRKIRSFLVDEDIITIPDYIGELDTNVPWIVREKGPNFWEQIQYRNPTPDHLHAVIPGHRFDGVVEDHNTHPIRGRLTDGARAEGWAVCLEEAMMNAGLIDDVPRVRELIYLFGIFRAARMPVDVWLQQSEMTVSEAVDYWMERVPYLDADVARVDAEIYLRRPPGYGLGYMTGMVQMQALLADQKRQLGAEFNLQEFHDTLMRSGRLPLSLLRWEMTGLDDEVADLWRREPLPL